MAIALSGSATSSFLTSAGTSITCNVPSGIKNGDMMIWALGSNQNAAVVTPSGWNVMKAVNGTANALGIYWRVASSEPASYTASGLNSGAWSSMMQCYSGVDTVTPSDVTVPTPTAGTTTTTFPAITPATVGAWVIPVAKVHGASGTTFTFSNGNADALDASMSANNGASPNIALAFEHKVWSSGAYTATITVTGTTARTYGAPFALRPARTVPYRMPREAVTRSYVR